MFLDPDLLGIIPGQVELGPGILRIVINPGLGQTVKIQSFLV